MLLPVRQTTIIIRQPKPTRTITNTATDTNNITTAATAAAGGASNYNNDQANYTITDTLYSQVVSDKAVAIGAPPLFRSNSCSQ